MTLVWAVRALRYLCIFETSEGLVEAYIRRNLLPFVVKNQTLWALLIPDFSLAVFL